MGEVQYRLGDSIALNTMIPVNAGVATNTPIHGNNNAGLYLILNNNTGNRYLGITTDYATRFSSRQGACFELGFSRANLDNIYAFLGTMRFRDTGAVGWTDAPSYDANGNLTCSIDGNDYDLEHLFIKAVQHAWNQDTVSNTRKTGQIDNNHMTEDVEITISWTNTTGNGLDAGDVDVTLAAQNHLA